MKTILITGASGNVGSEILKNINPENDQLRLLAGVREQPTERQEIEEFGVEKIHFDLDDPFSIKEAFRQSDVVFLLRPPQISDVKKYFQPLIDIAVDQRVNHIVFLSVQGADTSSIIPHYKIEKLIEKSGINYTFLRPAYFMQNFTTTLRNDLVKNQIIYLPAGKAKFTLIDATDLGLVAAKILKNPEGHINKAYDLTNHEQLSFGEMADILSEVLHKKIKFISPSLLSFYFKKRREKVPPMFIFVMIMLHYLPRFKPTPKTSNLTEVIMGSKPKSFRDFAIANKFFLQ